MEVLISKTKPEMVWYNCRKLAWERGLQGLSTGRWELIVTWKNKTANSNTSLDLLLFVCFGKMNR